MTQTASAGSQSSRISVDMEPSVHRLIEKAAKVHGQTIGQYALEAIEGRLRHDLDAVSASNVMTAATDPVLAELWDNPMDAEYDRFESR